MKRRHALRILSGSLFAAFALIMHRNHVEAANMDLKPWRLTEEEWRQRLTTDQYHILREQGTEPPFSSPLLYEHRPGVYACAGCGLALFDASAKFESGTGWPSFYAPIDGRIETKLDFRLVLPRKEYHCIRCGGHQGHVFDDGPEPTGQRWCNNGLALRFIPR
ncbi:MAG: peptide-methionine (R)-S-oxide reductase [Zetaproteobacteria bacterium]|nr:MAG: peptide-methionine (R)-S-oxide reductase [Zetaproteobacteria bacterium]